jgi:hypothetical protein
MDLLRRNKGWSLSRPDVRPERRRINPRSLHAQWYPSLDNRILSSHNPRRTRKQGKGKEIGGNFLESNVGRRMNMTAPPPHRFSFSSLRLNERSSPLTSVYAQLQLAPLTFRPVSVAHARALMTSLGAELRRPGHNAPPVLCRCSILKPCP